MNRLFRFHSIACSRAKSIIDYRGDDKNSFEYETNLGFFFNDADLFIISTVRQ